MISRPDNPNSTTGKGYYKSKSVKYSEFEATLSADIYASLGLGSIAYEPVDAYSKADHAHPEYSSIEISSFCSNRSSKVLCSLVTFEDDGISENVSIPYIRHY